MAVTTHYLLNRIWTFKDKETNAIKGYITFYMLCFLGVGVRLIVMQALILTTKLDSFPYGYVAINFIGIISAMLFNFFVPKKFIFKKAAQGITLTACSWR